jgi:hypothetical protein
MAVDMHALNNIHRLEVEIAAAIQSVKALLERREEIITDLAEYQALDEALVAVSEARALLKIAIRDNRQLNGLEVEIAEARFKLRDEREMLSHHLVVYTQDTGRDVLKDHEARTRQIELRAKLGKRALDQERLPLGLSKHYGAHVEIPTGQRAEVKPGEIE